MNVSGGDGFIRVAVTGALGRMGSEVVKAVSGAEDMCVAAQIVRGDDVSAALASSKPDVLVEFSLPDAAMSNIRAALAANVVPIVGTTAGLNEDNLAKIRAMCARYQTGALVAPNFAIGAVLMMRFAAEAARYLPDVEIIEMHHERKIDSPSGTALKTAEMISAARAFPALDSPAGAFETALGARGGKAAGNIAIHSVRLPGFVASQEVLFGGPGQRLSLRHDSIDRASFMPGVLLAIRQARALDGLVYGLEKLL